MGRDVHLYLEFDSEGSARFADPVAFADGRLRVPRDYRLFQALAGLGRVADRRPEPLVAPRGLPAKHSDTITKDFYQPVRYPGEDLWGPHESVSLEDATRWVAEGRATFVDSGIRANGLVSVPDWHTPGWLLESEVTASLVRFGLREPELSVEFRAILKLMRYFEAELGTGCTRLVFWFDN